LTQGAKVLARFSEHRALPRLLQHVNSPPANAPPNAVAVEAVLLELRALLGCAQEFAAAMHALLQARVAWAWARLQERGEGQVKERTRSSHTPLRPLTPLPRAEGSGAQAGACRG